MNSYRSFLWMVVWAGSFSITVSLIKVLETTPIHTALVVRLGFALIILLPSMIKKKHFTRMPQQLPLYIFNGLIRGAALFCVYYAYSKLPMAIASSVGYTDSLITVILAMFILKERVNFYQWLAVGIGYLGVVMMYQPQGTTFNIALCVALLSNLFAALAKISTKILLSTEDNISILFFGQTIAFMCCLGINIYSWQMPPMHDLYCLVFISVAGTLSGYAYLQALRYADVSFIAPLDYLKLIFTVPVSFVIFNEMPTLHAIYGCIIILIASIILMYKRDKKQPS